LICTLSTVASPSAIAPSMTGRKDFDLFRPIDDLDNDRQIGRELQDFRRAHSTARAKPLDAAQHCGSRQAMFSGRAHDPLIEQHTGMPIALADKNTQQRAFARKRRHD